jgi:hypothetical protein
MSGTLTTAITFKPNDQGSKTGSYTYKPLSTATLNRTYINLDFHLEINFTAPLSLPHTSSFGCFSL